MSVKNGSAEIFELDDARARLRAADIDPRNYLAVGPYLEAVRERHGLSIATVSDRTHVKASYIDAIERMATDGLPSKPYAIGFVRVYAEALGLDPGPVVERFKNEAGFGAAKAAAPAVAAPIAAPPRAEPRGLSLIAVLAVLGFMVWCAFIVTRPGADAVKRPLKLDSGVPLAAPPVEAPAAAPVSVPSAAATGAPATPTPAAPVIVEAQALDRIEPVYPPDCETAAAPAETVDLAFTVAPDGGVTSERVVQSSNPCFNRAALNALKRWRFSPRTIDGAARPAFEQRQSFRFDRPS